MGELIGQCGPILQWPDGNLPFGGVFQNCNNVRHGTSTGSLITVAERNVRLTQKYIKENLDDGPEDAPDFTLLYKEPIASQVFAYAQHMGDRGFTQRDISSEIMRGYGRLEPRNIVRNMLEKHKLIKKAGKREVGRQRHDLYQSKCPLVNNSLKLGSLISAWALRLREVELRGRKFICNPIQV